MDKRIENEKSHTETHTQTHTPRISNKLKIEK